MTTQEANGAMLLNLWNLGEHAFDAMLESISKKVEKVMTPADNAWPSQVKAWNDACDEADRIQLADGAICQNCKYPYEEHGGLESFCPNIWDEDSDWSTTKRFRQ